MKSTEMRSISSVADATRLPMPARPWAEAHGYPRDLAPRGRRGIVVRLQCAFDRVWNPGYALASAGLASADLVSADFSDADAASTG